MKLSIFVLTADLNPAMNDEMDFGNRLAGLGFICKKRNQQDDFHLHCLVKMPDCSFVETHGRASLRRLYCYINILSIAASPFNAFCGKGWS